MGMAVSERMSIPSKSWYVICVPATEAGSAVVVVLCALGLVKKKQSDVHPWPASTAPSVGGLCKLSIYPHLDPSPNGVDSAFDDIQSPGQTTENEQVELLKETRGAMTLRTHQQKLGVQTGLCQLGGTSNGYGHAYIVMSARYSLTYGILKASAR